MAGELDHSGDGFEYRWYLKSSATASPALHSTRSFIGILNAGAYPRRARWADQLEVARTSNDRRIAVRPSPIPAVQSPAHSANLAKDAAMLI